MSTITDEKRPRVQKDCGPPEASRTHQSFKDDCDVNVVMKRFANNGVIPSTNKREPTYGDYTNSVDYLENRTALLKADKDFSGLPSAVRTACDNDPAKFLDLVTNEENRAELVELGLVEDEIPTQLVQLVPAPEPPAEEGEG